MADLHIRALQAGDEDDWRRLWTLYLEYYESSVAEAVYQSTFARLLADNDQEFRGLIAFIDGKAVGLTHYLFHRHCWRIENVCYLQDLVVDTDYRGKRIGRALIEAVYAAADEEGSPRVYWLTQEFNEAGRRLYDQVGELTPFIRYDRPG